MRLAIGDWKKKRSLVDFQSHCPIFRLGTRIPSIYCILCSKRDLELLDPFLLFSRERKMFWILLASHHAPYIVGFSFWGGFYAENGQWCPQRCRKSLCPWTQVTSFYASNFPPASIAIALFLSHLSPLILSSPYEMMCHCSSPLSMPRSSYIHLVIQVREAIAAVEKWVTRARYLEKSFKTLDSRDVSA